MEHNDNHKTDKLRPNSFGKFIGNSSAMLDIFQKIEDAAPTNSPVFITGDSGTGKEIAAQALHLHSRRKQKPFIALNCATLSNNLVESALFGHVKGAFTGADKNRAGAIESAEGGTLFLDEICEMPLELQAKLLRFCQDFHYQKLGSDRTQKADIRIVCATNQDPITYIKQGLFREDLYYRLHVIPIEIPPLKDRGEDVIDLAYYFLYQYRLENNVPAKDFSYNARYLLQQYQWPGNVRELQNLIQQLGASVKHPVIMETMLPDHIKKTAFHSDKKPLEGINHISLPLWQIEKQAIEQAIALCGGNIPKAAAMLDIAASTIYRKKQSWDKK